MNASKPTIAAYFDHIGSIELPTEIWDLCPHTGAADESIAYMLTLPEVITEISEIDPDKLRTELKEYGAWDDNELLDHNANLARILWIASGNIHDGLYN